MLLIGALLFLSLGAVYLFVWRLEFRKTIVITPFVFAIYFLWLRFYPSFLAAPVIEVTGSWYAFCVGTAAIILFICGFLMGCYSSKTRSCYTKAISYRIRHREYAFYRYDLPMIMLGVALLILSLAFYQGLPSLLKALMSFFSGDYHLDVAQEIRGLRYDQTKAAYFGEEYRGQGLFRTAMTLGWPIVTAYFVIRQSVSGSTKILIAAVFFGACGVSFILSIGSRGPILVYLMMLLSSWSMYRPIKLHSLFLSASAVIVLAVLVGALSTKMDYLLKDPGVDSIKRAGVEISERIIHGNARNDIYVIDLVEEGVWEKKYGKANLRNIITSLPGVQYGVPIGRELFLQLNPGSSETTFETGTYMSELYVDFGIWGVILGYLLCGVVLGAWQRMYFGSLSGNPIVLAAFGGVISYCVALVLVVGISGLIANAVMLVAFWVLVVLSRTFFDIVSVTARKERPVGKNSRAERVL